MKTIKLPSTVTSIEKGSFFKREQSGTTIPSNPNLESIIYPGTTALTWDYAIGGLSSGVNPTAKNLPPYTYNGVSITAS